MKKPRRSTAKNKKAAPPVSRRFALDEWEKDPLAVRQHLRQLMGEQANRQETLKRGGQKESYLYLYDGYLKEGAYRSILTIIENCLADFEIEGKIVRLSAFTNPRLVIEDEMRHGAKNVVIVGNDGTLAKVLTRAADLGVIFGFLPVGQKKNYLAKVLGLPLNEKAVEALAARKIEKIDYASINGNRFFLSYLYIPAARVKIECDRNFAIQPSREKFELAVANLLPPPFAGDKFSLHPQDGQMEFYLREAKPGMLASLVKSRHQARESVFPFQHLFIKSDKPMTVVADGQETRETAVEIEVAKNKLKMIVGKGRQF